MRFYREDLNVLVGNVEEEGNLILCGGQARDTITRTARIDLTLGREEDLDSL